MSTDYEVKSVADMRRDYRKGELVESQVASDPFTQFERWFADATAAQQASNGLAGEANAMTLATVADGGRPAARIVLLKGFDVRGFVFYTNYESRKANEIAATDHAALLFHWHTLERQVRIEGAVEKVSADESDAYYQSRPAASRIGAWASPQSREIASREALETLERQMRERHGESPLRPPHWGGYRVKPDYFEFWQGRSSRLHDRIVYRPLADDWSVARLAP
jgi:pyridoxamine 5'-phosphate oxidase